MLPRRLQTRSAFVLAASLALTLCVAGPAFAQKKYALVVGVKKYKNNDGLTELKYTENDANDLKKALLLDKSKKSGFDEVVLMTQSAARDDEKLTPTADNIRKQLARLQGKMKDGDVLLLSLSGHGMTVRTKAQKDEHFFCPEDAAEVTEDANDVETLEKSMICLSTVLKGWDASAKKKVRGVKLLLVDACRNDVTLKGAKTLSPDYRPNLSKGVSALFSCNTGEFSYETEKLGGGHGIFTYYVIEALKMAKNGEGKVTWGMMADYVPQKVAEAAIKYVRKGAQQTPHLVTNLVGATPVLTEPAGEVTENDVFRQALACYTGKGDMVDLPKAYRLFGKAGKEGHVVARATQAFMMHLGQGTERDPEEAARIIEKLLPELKKAAKTDDNAQLRLGALYALGVGVEKDEKEAARLYERAVERKNSMAMNNLANLLMHGDGVRKDVEKGLELYKEAAKFGEVAAMLNLGIRYTVGGERGAGVEKDLEEAFAWYEKAAKVGSADGMFELAKRYEQGAGVKKDEKKAVRLFEDAIDRDHAGAMTSLGVMYEDGRGVPKSLTKAFELYQRSAKAGYLPGMFNLGICYRNEIGTKQDKDEAIRWFRKVVATKPRSSFEAKLRKEAQEQLVELGDKF